VKILSGTKLYVIHWLIYPCRMVRGDVPYYVKIWLKLTNPLQKRQFPVNIRL